MSNEKQVGDYYVCHHVIESDIDERPDLTRNPIKDPDSDFKHVGDKDDHFTYRTKRINEIKMHEYECPACGKKRFVCPVCKSQGEFESDRGKRISCHHCG
jgi:nucleoside phosphorylase